MSKPWAWPGRWFDGELNVADGRPHGPARHRNAFEVLARANALAAEGPLDHQSGDRQPVSDPDHIVEAGRRRSPTVITAILPPTAFRPCAPRSPPICAAPPGRGCRPTSAGRAGRQVTMFFAIMMFGEPERRSSIRTPASDL